MSEILNQDSMSRLRWQCRRGMLELDLILNTFMDRGYAKLDDQQRVLFQQVLDYPDQLLFDLLLEQMKSSDREVANLVTLIRNTLRDSD
ncbi:MAG: succinate dehydrogenase assembly factor 2 [Gammaproteobacteria bacterium]|nr:MAG: succinate dehydrogenase assembly factor 2 [Gammaproteobacteria bacterium]